jgi:hypothetical protein
MQWPSACRWVWVSEKLKLHGSYYDRFPAAVRDAVDALTFCLQVRVG